jgi:hypothetical protein
MSIWKKICGLNSAAEARARRPAEEAATVDKDLRLDLLSSLRAEKPSPNADLSKRYGAPVVVAPQQPHASVNSNTGQSKSETPAEKLASSDEAIFLQALQKAVSYAPRGDATGLEAMREAIRKRAGNREVKFYTPGFVFRNVGEAMSAREQLLQLAIKKALLNDPAQTGNLIMAFRAVNGFQSFFPLLEEMDAKAGFNQTCAFQLIFNEIRANAQLTLGRIE